MLPTRSIQDVKFQHHDSIHQSRSHELLPFPVQLSQEKKDTSWTGVHVVTDSATYLRMSELTGKMSSSPYICSFNPWQFTKYSAVVGSLQPRSMTRLLSIHIGENLPFLSLKLSHNKSTICKGYRLQSWCLNTHWMVLLDILV